MNQTACAILFACALLVGMPLFSELGRWWAGRQIVQEGPTPGGRGGLAAVDGAVFGLLGLLIAFTFSGALTRFDARRQVIVQEANCIGTAFLRLDVLPPDDQKILRELFRQYADSRLSVYRKLPDIVAARSELARSGRLQTQIWTNAVAACGRTSSPASGMLLLPALNQMIDITTTRTMMSETHPPPVIYAMLGALALVSSMLAGYEMAGGRRNWLHTIVFPLVVAISVYVILDLEYPRFGLIRVDTFDHVLEQVRQGME